MNKKTILIFIDWYLPGYKAGGPIKSVASYISHFKNEFDFYIITTDTDFGETEPYPSVKSNHWNTIDESVKVFYISTKFLSWRYLLNLTKSIKYDFVYLNSFFSKYFSLYPLHFKKLKYIHKPVIIAPRGMLGDGALNIKKKKKKIFIKFSKIIGLHKNVIWHATSLEEYNEIKTIYGNSAIIKIAPNLQYKQSEKIVIPTNKEKNKLKLFFLSRISEKKNLLYALDVLLKVNVANIKLEFNIIGPNEDLDYWNLCLKKIEELKKKNIAINYLGAIKNEEIEKAISSFHFLFLPTLNENYGHVIVESLMFGKPVIISNQTPWKNLEVKKVGWDISLNTSEIFVNVIEQCAKMEQREYCIFSKSASEFSKEQTLNPQIIEQNRQLFV